MVDSRGLHITEFICSYPTYVLVCQMHFNNGMQRTDVSVHTSVTGTVRPSRYHSHEGANHQPKNDNKQ